MTDQDLYRIPATRHPTGDALRTLALILATVVVGLVVVAAVPDRTWSELTAVDAADLPEWHGNVAAQASRY